MYLQTLNLDSMLRDSKVIFTGRVVKAVVLPSANSERDSIVGEVEALDLLKGKLPRPLPGLQSLSDASGATCEMPILVGTVYVFFMIDAEQPTMYLGSCAPTMKFHELIWDIANACKQGSNNYLGFSCNEDSIELFKRATNASKQYGQSLPGVWRN
ncbi:MAG: hypothetical protein IPI75_03630 [Gammaproteobacteria bacterium]|nr:hypothetical protein [Gammaproteobacteria bacterium]